jgi:hypothetical protein
LVLRSLATVITVIEVTGYHGLRTGGIAVPR